MALAPEGAFLREIVTVFPPTRSAVSVPPSIIMGIRTCFQGGGNPFVAWRPHGTLARLVAGVLLRPKSGATRVRTDGRRSQLVVRSAAEVISVTPPKPGKETKRDAKPC